MLHHYILLPDHSVQAVTLEEWAKSFESGNRHVGDDTIVNGKKQIRVSTVFLGLDHRFGDDGPPILFETMLFGFNCEEEYQERYCTWEEAEAWHQKAIQVAQLRIL